MRMWRAPKHVNTRGMSLDSVARELSVRFPFLNLKGLARVRGLNITIETFRNLAEDGGKAYEFHVRHWEQEDESGRVLFLKGYPNSDLRCPSIYPHLPRDKNLGVTLFTMILLRGNTYADSTVWISRVNALSIKMANKMLGFDAKLLPRADELHRDVTLKVPRLKPKEVSAVEWYWRRILHMGAK